MPQKTAKPSVAIVIVNYNGFSDTVECIESLQRSTHDNWTVFVVDNASPDQSGQRLSDLYSSDKKVDVIKSSVNMGFGGANNLAMRQACNSGFDYVMLLNNDTVVEPNMLERLLGLANGDAVVAPLMTYYEAPEIIWFAGGYFDKWKTPRHKYMRMKVQETQLVAQPVEWITGCCMLLPRRAVELTGGFDEAYFLYWEDVDWSIRLRSAGFKLLFEPSACLRHKVSASVGGEASKLSYYYGTRNRLYAIDKLHLGGKAKIRAIGSAVLHSLSQNEQYAFVRVAYKDYRKGKMGQKDNG